MYIWIYEKFLGSFVLETNEIDNNNNNNIKEKQITTHL